MDMDDNPQISQIENFENIPENIAKNICVVFSDIDDTISTHGKILPQSYNAIWDLYYSGIDVVLITGRCAGWVDHLARMWPVKAVVGENGAFYAYMDYTHSPPKLKKRYYLNPEEVKQNKKKFELIKKEVFQKFPNIDVASDQPYREFDLAIDFCEDVPPLSLEEVEEIVKIFQKYGANTKISSIHVNGWFGDYDKLKMVKIFAKEQLNMNIDDQNEITKCLYIGDSPNDQPMFSKFPISVAVANIKKFIQKNLISDYPTYITTKEAGLGFAEMVNILLEKKKLPQSNK
ncbi:MAG: HAD-IIB family hydrolase [Promethearchaeota archaeon]